MKKHNILIALAMAIVVLFTACNGGNPQEPGKVRVILDSWQDTRSIESNVPLDTASYGITAIYQGSGNVESVVQTADANAKDVTLSLFPGNWKIQVDAFNADGQKIGTGMSDVVSVSSGATTPCKVRVDECSGLGTLNVRLSGVYEGYNVKATIEREMGEAHPIVFNLDKAEGTYYGSMNLEHGSYLFNLFLDGKNIWTEAVRVVAHGQTNADVSVYVDNRIELNTRANVNVNRITSDSLTDGSTVENGSSYVFHAAEPSIWFVDGVRQSGVKSTDFTWEASGLTVGSSCTVGALSGHETYDTFSSMHFTAADSSSRVVTASFANHTYMVGGQVVIHFNGLPSTETEIGISLGNYTVYSSVSSEVPDVYYYIPAEITEAGEYEIIFKVPEGSGIIIPPLKIKLGLPDFEASYNVSIKPDAYIGDYVIANVSEIPFGVEVRGYIDGVERWTHSSRRIYSRTKMNLADLNDITPGTYEFEIKLFNAGRELPLVGNKATITVHDEYVVPEGLTISAAGPVYNGNTIKFTVNPVVPIDIRLDVSCDGKPMNGYFWIDADNPEFEIQVPTELTVGNHVFTFTGRSNNKVHALPSVEVQVAEMPKKEVEGELPKYIRSYYRNYEVFCDDPDFVAYEGHIDWFVNGQPVDSSNKKAGKDSCRVFFGKPLENDVEYTVTGSFKTEDKEISFKPMTFTASNNYLSFDVRSVYEAGRVDYSITPDIHLGAGETYETFTLNVKDGGELDQNLPVENGVEYKWSYDGKKPMLFLLGEVRDANGVLLLRETMPGMNYTASIVGPDVINLSDTVGESNQTYTVKYNRDDLDWGAGSNGLSWKFDEKWQDSDDFSITLNESLKGKHSLGCYRHVDGVWYNIAEKEIVVTEEKLDPGMSFNIVNMHRGNSYQTCYEFDFDSADPIQEHLTYISVSVDGVDISGDAHYAIRDEGGFMIGNVFYPDTIPLGKTLTLNVIRLSENGDTIARDRVDYALSDIFIRSDGSYYRNIDDVMSCEVFGIGSGEDYSILVDGNELDKTKDITFISGDYFELAIGQFGEGHHSLTVKRGADVSEELSWCVRQQVADMFPVFSKDIDNFSLGKAKMPTSPRYADMTDGELAVFRTGFLETYSGPGDKVDIAIDRKSDTFCISVVQNPPEPANATLKMSLSQDRDGNWTAYMDGSADGIVTKGYMVLNEALNDTEFDLIKLPAGAEVLKMERSFMAEENTCVRGRWEYSVNAASVDFAKLCEMNGIVSGDRRNIDENTIVRINRDDGTDRIRVVIDNTVKYDYSTLIQQFLNSTSMGTPMSRIPNYNHMTTRELNAFRKSPAFNSIEIKSVSTSVDGFDLEIDRNGEAPMHLHQSMDGRWTLTAVIDIPDASVSQHYTLTEPSWDDDGSMVFKTLLPVEARRFTTWLYTAKTPDRSMNEYTVSIENKPGYLLDILKKIDPTIKEIPAESPYSSAPYIVAWTPDTIMVRKNE